MYDYLLASNGSGDAAIMHVQADRAISSTTIDVDGVTNVPAKFIGTSGTLLPSGFIDPETITNFYGHTSGGDLIIDSFADGSTDAGNTEGQVVVVKPTTEWANLVAAHIMNMTNNGTPEDVTVNDIDVAGNATIDGNATVGGNLSVTGSFRPKPRVSATTSTATLTPDIDSYNIYELSAQAANLTIAAPTGTPNSKDIIVIYIKDNGTSRTISWNAIYTNISGLDSLTSTTIGKWHTVGMQYNAGLDKWQIVSITTEA